MKKKSNKIIALTLILLLTLGFSGVEKTNAYYDDKETSGGNFFSTSSLDFSLNSDADFAPEVNPEINALRSISISNDGSLGFQYTIKTTGVIGGLCDALDLSASLDGGLPVTESLSTFEIGPFNFNAPENWDFTATLTSDAPELEGMTCEFNFEYFGWQTDLTGPSPIGFNDTETITNTVTAETWGLDYGPIEDFAVFGASDVSDTNETETGNSSYIVGGMIGSNRSVEIGSLNVQLGIRAGSKVTTHDNVTIGAKGIIVNGSVTLGGSNIINGSVHGASVTVGSSTNLNGDVVSGGLFSTGANTQASLDVDAQSATLGNSADILGTLTLPNTVLPTLVGDATVGTLNNDGTPLPATPDTFTDISLPTPNIFSANADAGKDININTDNSPLTLAPGIYRDLTSTNSKTLNLTAGTYVFRSFSLAGNNIINADVSGGEILIFVVGDVTTGSNLDFNLTGGTADKIYLESGGVVSLGGSNDWYGTIYSTKSNLPNEFGITTGNNTDVWGALYSSEQIRLGGANNITLVGPFFGIYSVPSNVSDIALNEIYPSPAGGVAPSDREWIELYNTTASSIDVLDWKISEIAGATETFYSVVASGATANQVQPYAGASTIIPSGGLLVLEFGNLTARLNNTGDTVRLYNSTNIFMDGHAYPSTAVGKSHQRIPNGGIWVDPEPTPGESNRVSMQDLINAGLDEGTIQLIIALLAEKGETLLEEETVVEMTTAGNINPEVNTEETMREIIEDVPPAVVPEAVTKILEVVDTIVESVTPPPTPEPETEEVPVLVTESEPVIASEPEGAIIESQPLPEATAGEVEQIIESAPEVIATEPQP